MRILVDMDGVLTDFDQGFINKWREKYPGVPYVGKEKRLDFYVENSYLEALKSRVRPLMKEPGFYRDLPPMKGGLEALMNMEDMGIEVFICSSPLIPYANCVKEKFEWVDKYLGEGWVKKLILTKDKTVVHGDILIDDKPKIKGIQIPTWEHVLYSQPYNQNASGIPRKKRLTWENWVDVLGV